MGLDADLRRRLGAHGPALQLEETAGLYLSLRPETALREVTGGFARRLSPFTLCSYEVDCDYIVDLRGDVDGTRLQAPQCSAR